MSHYEEDKKAFDEWINKPIDWDAVGKPITQLSVIKWSRDPDLDKTGVANLFWIEQAFIIGRESMRPKPPAESDEEAFRKLKEYIERARKSNDCQNKTADIPTN